MNKHSPKPVLLEPASIVLPMKRTGAFAPCQDTAQSKQRFRTLRTTLDTMISLDTDRLSEADLDGQAADAGHGGTLENEAMHVSLWEKDMHRIQAQEALSDATMETEAIPRRQRTLSDEAGRRRRFLVSRMANDAAASGMNL